MSSRWVILAVLFFARTTMAFQFQSVAALAPLVVDDYGASLADIGLLIGFYFAPGIVIAIPGGAIAKRLGDRASSAAGMVLMLLGALLPVLDGSWAMLVAGRVVAGIGGVILSVLTTKMLTDWFAGREISTAMAIYVNSWPVGIALALLVLPAVAGSGGLDLAWVAVLSLIAIGLVLFVTGYRPPAHATAPPTATTRTGGLPLAPVLFAGTIWALYNTALAMVFGFGPTLLSQRGWSLGRRQLDHQHRPLADRRLDPDRRVARRSQRPPRHRHRRGPRGLRRPAGRRHLRPALGRAGGVRRPRPDRRPAGRADHEPAVAGPAGRDPVARHGRLLHHLLRRLHGGADHRRLARRPDRQCRRTLHPGCCHAGRLPRRPRPLPPRFDPPAGRGLTQASGAGPARHPAFHACRSTPMTWSIHHVNLPATDVRASAEFYTKILGMAEGAWTFPPPEQVGHISADPQPADPLPCTDREQGRE